jgi:hypothetical protein
VTIDRADALDDALDRLDSYHYLVMPGPFACHGPMGAETLSTLGYNHLVGTWVEEYKSRHQPLGPFATVERIDPADRRSWQAALGDITRVSDWAALFHAELTDDAWPAVVRRWLPWLLPGCAGGLTHGLIRVAHAVRALTGDSKPSQLLLAELAKALALWAGAFTLLPGRPLLQGPLTLEEAISKLPRPKDPWLPIEAGTFARIHELEEFPSVVEALRPPDLADQALSDLSIRSCQVMLNNPALDLIPLVHTLTPIAAVRILQPHIPLIPTEIIYAQLWHVNAGILCGFTPAQTPPEATNSDRNEPPPLSEIIAQAVEHQDPHVLKFTEACAREYALRPDPTFLLAAQTLLKQTPAW